MSLKTFKNHNINIKTTTRNKREKNFGTELLTEER